MMSMLSDFFKDYGYGNYYQGSAKNTSGQWYDPANYGGLKAFDPNKPNDPGSIGPGTYGRASLGNWLGNFSAMPADGGAQRAVSPLTAPGNWQTGGGQNSYYATVDDRDPRRHRFGQTGGGQNSYDATPLSPMPALPAWATQGTPTRWEELVATGQAPKTNTNIPVPAVAGGMQRVLSYGNARQAGQGVQSPQSAYAYTLADLLRNYYA